MGQLGDLEAFLHETGDLGAVSNEAPIDPIAAQAQQVYIDRPWRQIDVTAYIGVAEWLVSKPFDIAAARFAKNDEEKFLIALDDEDKQGLRPLLTEAVQKCVHDLKANFLQNPYAGLGVGLAALVTAKSASLKIQRMRSAKHPSQSSPNQSQQPNPSQSQRSQARDGAIPIRQGSPMENGRMGEFAGASSSAAYPEAGKQSFYVDEFGDAAG
jgi:hypothetical protein